jgi:hypothetical protein
MSNDASAGLALRHLKAEDLMTQARRIANLEDFGDPWFVDPLRALIEFVNLEANLITTDCASVEIIRGCLVDRLRLVDFLKKNPKVYDEKVDVGGIVVSMPRGGSTLTQRLLCASPQITAPYFWEMMMPFPPPGETPGVFAPRIAQAQAILDARSRDWPGSTAIHPMYAEAYDEESFLVTRSFLSVDFIFYFHLPGYIRWLRKQDQTKAFSELKIWLQFLQYQNPAHRGRKWVLKTAHYIWSGGLRQILRTFPDAVAFTTHRNLESVIPSCCSLQNTFIAGHTRNFDPKVLGREAIELYRDAFEDLIAVRSEPFASRFIDIQYKDLIDDPYTQYRRGLEKMGLSVGLEDERAGKRWIEESRRDAHSRHAYTPADYGITREEINGAFKFYTDLYVTAH